MNTRTYIIVSASVFSLIAFVHLLRVLFGWEVIISSWSIPLWFSWIGVLIGGVLGYFGFKNA